MTLTESQKTALRWLRDFPSHQSEWRENGKPARGKPEKWNEMRVSGERGELLIPIDDWIRLHDLIEHIPNSGKIFQPNAAGLAALTGA